MQETTVPTERANGQWLDVALFALPAIGAAIGPFAVEGEFHWLVKAIVGFLFGASISAIGWKGRFLPPLSTAIAAVAAVLMFASITVLAVASPVGSTSTILIASVISVALFWALTR